MNRNKIFSPKSLSKQDNWKIAVENLTVRFANKETVFNNLCLDIPGQQIFGILGETGCGKSTLAMALAGLLPGYWEGEITYHHSSGSKKLSQMTPTQKFSQLYGKLVSYAPQDPYKTLNPFEKVAKQLQRASQQAFRNSFSLEEIASELDISPAICDSFPHTLSAGQQQRVVVALSLLNGASTIILDEPTASLDSQVREKLLRLLQQLPEKGHTLIVISHEMEEYHHLLPEGNRFYFSHPHLATELSCQQPTTSLPAKTRQPLLEVCHVQKTFGNQRLLHHADLKIYPQEWIYLEGTNGSGKSTLIKLILGLETPDAGEIHWQGKNPPALNTPYLHVVFQDSFNYLNPRWKIRDSLDELKTARKTGDREEQQAKLWAMLELPAPALDKLPGQLSYGQQKRVVLLRSLLKYFYHQKKQQNQQHLFIFDEVFSGIHWQLREKILVFLKQLAANEQNFAILWISHSYPLLRKSCDRIYRIEDGTTKALNESK